jgi:hypothetical protein
VVPVYPNLLANPLLFVDAFVNYHCNISSHFDNLFQNTLNLIAKLAYPSMPCQHVALDVLLGLVQSLCTYFSNMPSADPPQKLFEAMKTTNLFSDGPDLFKPSCKTRVSFFIKHHFMLDCASTIAPFLFTNPALHPSAIRRPSPSRV